MDAFPFFLEAPVAAWHSLYRDAEDPDKVIGRIAVDFNCEVRDVNHLDEFTFATVVINGKHHRVALRAFPGVYALVLKSEDVEKLEKRLREVQGEEVANKRQPHTK